MFIKVRKICHVYYQRLLDGLTNINFNQKLQNITKPQILPKIIGATTSSNTYVVSFFQ